MKRMPLIAVSLFLILAAGALAVVLVRPPSVPLAPASDARSVVSVRGKNFKVDVADTMMKQARGLSGRESLGEDEGMFFIFHATGTHGFWMKDMKIPIDIIWILNDHVVGVEENVQPESEKSMFSLTRYYPPEPVNRVLEVPAGTVQKYGFKAVDAVEYFPVNKR